jgi:hypothetical protein
MRIATYNVNGVNGRLPVLLRWLEQTSPDVVCLQELKAPQDRFPEEAIRDAGYGAIWHGQKSWNGVAILQKGSTPVETHRGLPGDPEDLHSRYIEAAIEGITIGCLYLPNGNPAPGPKFDYKLRWFERLHKHARKLLKQDTPVILAGDFNVMPTELDVYRPESWVDDALFRPDLHLLGLLPELLRTKRRPADRSLPPQPASNRAPRRRRSRSGGPRLGKDQRPCPHVDRAEGEGSAEARQEEVRSTVDITRPTRRSVGAVVTPRKPPATSRPFPAHRP